MTFLQLLAESRRLVKANSTTYTTADITESVNRAMDRVVALIRQAEGRWQWDDSNYNTLPSGTTDIEEGQGNYTLDPTYHRIQKVEVLNENGDWSTLTPFDISDPKCASYSNLMKDTGFPCMYDKVGNSLVLAPMPDFDREDALKVSYERGASYFIVDDTTKEPGFNPMFHRLLTLWAAYDYAVINQLPIAKQLGTPVKEGNNVGMIASMEKELQDFYAMRDKDDKVTLKVTRHSFR